MCSFTNTLSVPITRYSSLKALPDGLIPTPDSPADLRFHAARHDRDTVDRRHQRRDWLLYRRTRDVVFWRSAWSLDSAGSGGCLHFWRESVHRRADCRGDHRAWHRLAE